MTFNFQHLRWCKDILFHLVMKFLRNSCKSEGLCTHSRVSRRGKACLPSTLQMGMSGPGSTWRGWRQVQLWLWRLPGLVLQLQGQGTPPGWRDAGGLSQGMSKVVSQELLSPDLHCMRNHPGLWLNCPALSTKFPCAHIQALFAYLSGSTFWLSVSSQLFKEQHLKNKFIIP